MGSSDFVHLHVHSEYSLLDGASRIDNLVMKAKSLGMTSLALTDHGVLYGAIPFYKACLKHHIKPIIGVEVYIRDEAEIEQKRETRDKKNRPRLYHLVLLAENYTGYQNLMKLTTKAHMDGFYYKPTLTKEDLQRYSKGIICLSACLAGEVQQAILNQDIDKAEDLAFQYEQIFGKGNFYLELQDHGMSEQKMINTKLVQLAKKLEIPLVVTNDVHYIEKQDAVAHDCLLCIGTGSVIHDEKRLKFPSNQFYLKSEEEMRNLFPHLDAAYQNTVTITERCQLEIPFGQEILPEYPVPAGEIAISYLRKLCHAGLEQRYEEVTPEIEARLEYELQVIGQMGYADYFLIVWDFMKFAHEQGIITGPGRGSAAGSLVAYVLRITNVDPIKYNLLFERFLNPERISMPDIDIDFSDQRRDEVIKYVLQKYGAEHVAQIITFGTMAAKAAVRDVGRALEIPLSLVNQVSKSIPSSWGITIKSALKESAVLQALYQENEKVTHLLNVAMQLEGLARHSSTHAAGVVISKEPLTNYVPLQQGHDNIPLTQYAMEELEDIGLLKMDFLGLRNLTLIEEIISIVNQEKLSETKVTLEQIPFEDSLTFQLLSEADTMGVFQLESDGMRRVLERLKPSCFEDVIAVLALYRPGPMQNIPLFIDAKHGRVDVEYPHEDLKPILEDTYGIIVYQEQIMQIASKMAGFSLGEADLLRRAVGKKKREILETEREHFVEGCLQQGYQKKEAEHVYDLIVRFADYGFNRSHSAAYAVIAYQLAYLKAHYPVAFLAALFSMSMGQQEKISEYMQQASKRGVKLLPPSIMHSFHHFSIEEGHIRFGLSLIKNVGSQAIANIVEEREKKPYKNVLDFCQRVNLKLVNRKVIEALILAGALDELGMHRAQMLANLDSFLEMAEQAQGIRASDQLFFFADELPDDYDWLDVPPLSIQEKLRMEKEVLGFYLSGHPLDSYRELASHYKAVPIPRLLQDSALAKVRTIGLITKLKRIKTKKGEAMAFVQLEDVGQELDLVVFPNIFKSFPTLYEEGTLLFVEGKLEVNDQKRQLIVQKASDMETLLKLHQEKEESPQQQKNIIKATPIAAEKQEEKRTAMDEVAKRLYIKIGAANEDSKTMNTLRHLLKQNKGEIPVYLYYDSRKQTIKLDQEYDITLSSTFLQQIISLLDDSEAVRVI